MAQDGAERAEESASSMSPSRGRSHFARRRASPSRASMACLQRLGNASHATPQLGDHGSLGPAAAQRKRQLECTDDVPIHLGKRPVVETPQWIQPSPVQLPRERVDESASTESVPCGRSDSLEVRVSGLTSRQLRDHQLSRPPQWVWLGSIGGRRICLPGVSTLRDDWRVPGQYMVGALVGTLVFMVPNDGLVDAHGERFRVSAVIVSRHQCVAPPSFELSECADARDFVTVVCGAQAAEFVGMPFVERGLIDLSNVSTPLTPDSPSSGS